MGDLRNSINCLLLLFCLTPMSSAASPDPRLLSLVPPGEQIVAGISAPSGQEQPDNLVLVTHYNKLDLEDFFALTGADDTRTVHQIVFMSVTNNEGQLKEHSLLVSGHFDQWRVFKSAADGGAAETNYRSIPILVIQPLARERDTFNQVRWLAILDSRVLVFGSIASTQLELDRYLVHSTPDETLLRRLASLRNKDQAWCVVSAPVRSLSLPAFEQEIYTVLAELNPELAELARSGSELAYGVHYGRRVEFEYEVAFASASASRVGPASLRQSPVVPSKSESLLPTLDTVGNANTRHRVIVLSMTRYKTWLTEIRRQRIPIK